MDSGVELTTVVVRLGLEPIEGRYTISYSPCRFVVYELILTLPGRAVP